jgi:chromosomal replication initiation ATPase DnaA
MMSDERVLGESGFVADILSQAGEKFERRYELKRLGYDLDQVAGRVAEIYGIKADDIFLKGKQQQRVKARSLSCYWAAEEMGITFTALARRLEIGVPAVGFSVERGRKIAQQNHYQFIE